MSGPQAIALAGVLVTDPARIAGLASHRLIPVPLIGDDGAPLDEAMCVVMRAPRSYTGEDVVEISCHGSPAVLRSVIARVCAAGARLAEPGEFTRRAFLNGRMDLARAEAVALLVSARTERAARLAARALSGFGDRLARLRDALIELMAGAEVRLDFPEETAGLPEVEIESRVAQLADTVEAWLRAAQHGRVVHEGLTVALIGVPNAGKSTLMNALLGRDRAIVSPTPGTTRDVVESTMAVAGVPVRLLDTAGLGTPQDAIEAEGMRRTRKAIDESDLVVVVADGTAPYPEVLVGAVTARDHIVVRSKADLPGHHWPGAPEGALAVCALDGSGLGALRRRIEAFVGSRVDEDGDEGGLVVSLRQRELLRALATVLRRAAQAASTAPLEITLVDLREALTAVSEILGVGVGDVVLDRIFADFCLGK